MTFTDADQNWRGRIQITAGKFTVDSVQYEKHTAGLAQTMGQMKGEKAPEKKIARFRALFFIVAAAVSAVQ